jgi:hypothetical protein
MQMGKWCGAFGDHNLDDADQGTLIPNRKGWGQPEDHANGWSMQNQNNVHGATAFAGSGMQGRPGTGACRSVQA